MCNESVPELRNDGQRIVHSVSRFLDATPPSFSFSKQSLRCQEPSQLGTFSDILHKYMDNPNANASQVNMNTYTGGARPGGVRPPGYGKCYSYLSSPFLQPQNSGKPIGLNSNNTHPSLYKENVYNHNSTSNVYGYQTAQSMRSTDIFKTGYHNNIIRPKACMVQKRSMGDIMQQDRDRHMYAHPHHQQVAQASNCYIETGEGRLEEMKARTL
eukprot:Ihof_evm5s202 gene=Ihof_evmTU5s202